MLTFSALLGPWWISKEMVCILLQALLIIITRLITWCCEILRSLSVWTCLSLLHWEAVRHPPRFILVRKHVKPRSLFSSSMVKPSRPSWVKDSQSSTRLVFIPPYNFCQLLSSHSIRSNTGGVVKGFIRHCQIMAAHFDPKLTTNKMVHLMMVPMLCITYKWPKTNGRAQASTYWNDDLLCSWTKQFTKRCDNIVKFQSRNGIVTFHLWSQSKCISDKFSALYLTLAFASPAFVPKDLESELRVTFL